MLHYMRRATVRRIDDDGQVFVEIPSRGPGFLVGPLQTGPGWYDIDDRVLVGCAEQSQDDYVLVGWLGHTRRELHGTAALNFTSIGAGAIGTATIPVVGAVAGDAVEVAVPSTIEAGLMWGGYVSAPDVVTIRLHNTTASPIDPASATFGAIVKKL